MTSTARGPEAIENRLRDIRALTDVSFGHLDAEDLLVALLDRVREILDVDTAAILLLDGGSDELVARAARGIEEEVRQGVRVPLRTGFAGRIAADKRPVVINRVDQTTVSNPILWEKGIRAMLGVPLLHGGNLLGVLHVGTLGSRRFTEKDIEVLQVVADRVAGTTQALLSEAEGAAADLLQRSLLPTSLPRISGLEFSARYVPAGQRGIGGDWYDVFTLPSGELWVVSGDVAGHGLRAAVVMGRLRSALRAYALIGGSPDEVLELTDRKLRHFEPDWMATIVCAAFQPPFEEVRISCAGHPPPVLALPGMPATIVELEVDIPIGTGVDIPRSCTTVAVPPGTVLFFYTDGLVERREEALDLRLERLCAAVTADRPVVVCHRVMSTLLGENEPDDDIAVLAVRHTADP